MIYESEAKPTNARKRNPNAMDCDKCGRESVMHAAYSGLHLCEEHFLVSVDKRVRRRIREDNLVPSDDSPMTRRRGSSGCRGAKTASC